MLFRDSSSVSSCLSVCLSLYSVFQQLHLLLAFTIFIREREDSVYPYVYLGTDVGCLTVGHSIIKFVSFCWGQKTQWFWLFKFQINPRLTRLPQSEDCNSYFSIKSNSAAEAKHEALIDRCFVSSCVLHHMRLVQWEKRGCNPGTQSSGSCVLGLYNWDVFGHRIAHKRVKKIEYIYRDLPLRHHTCIFQGSCNTTCNSSLLINILWGHSKCQALPLVMYAFCPSTD